MHSILIRVALSTHAKDKAIKAYDLSRIPISEITLTCAQPQMHLFISKIECYADHSHYDLIH